MAKTRAQRKAERRAREARQARQSQEERSDESRAQARTQTPESGDVAEVEAVLETGAPPEELGEHVRPKHEPEPEPEPEPELEAPAPSRAEVGAPPKEDRRERRRREKEARRRAREQERRRQPTEREERRRGPVLGFLISCWAELKRVQWPDRDTLVQASAVTLLFIAAAAAYLGALDAAFNWLVKQIL